MIVVISVVTLQFEEIGSLLIDVGSLCLEHLVQALALQTRSGHREVHERHTRADVRWELDL